MKKLLSEDIVNNVRKDNCFDFLRYLFAFSLIIAHFCTLTGQEQLWFITGSMRVKAFFTITGFLVTYSFLRRNDIVSYAVKRFARIVPAYACCILLCLLLGWAVSSLSTTDFFTSIQTYKYAIANILMLNWLEPELPSTFQNNIMPQMNGSLWSMKQEVIFYILVPIIIYTMKRILGRNILLLPMIVGMAMYCFMPVQMQYFMFFFSGMLLLMFFDIFCRNIHFILPLALLAEIPILIIDIPWLSPICQACEPLTFASIIIGVAYNCKPMNFLRRYDNITYGLYLYHFPVIQTLILYGVKDKDINGCFIITIILTSLLASLSWFVIEKPLINRFK